MPRKDNSIHQRQRKKDNKRGGGKNIYSSKHIRMQEALMQKNGVNKDQESFNIKKKK